MSNENTATSLILDTCFLEISGYVFVEPLLFTFFADDPLIKQQKLTIRGCHWQRAEECSTETIRCSSVAGLWRPDIYEEIQ